MTATFIARNLFEIWGEGGGLTIAGFGYPNPYLTQFSNAHRLLLLSPGAQGVIRWPDDDCNAACLCADQSWPLADGSIDRVLIVHGLEETSSPTKLMQEAARVLSDDGRIIIVVSHRRGLWSMVETTPLSAGRPYLPGQLKALLRAANLRPRVKNSALFFPPLRNRLMMRAAPSWERVGARLWPALGGVVMMEAEKEVLSPARAVRVRSGVLRPAIAARPAASSVRAPRTGRADRTATNADGPK